MRVGRWTKKLTGEGSATNVGFPSMPTWFEDNQHFGAIKAGLKAHSFAETETAAIMGENWLRFYDSSFGPKQCQKTEIGESKVV